MENMKNASVEELAETDSMNLAELTATVVQTGVEGLVDWDAQTEAEEEPDFEGGL